MKRWRRRLAIVLVLLGALAAAGYFRARALDAEALALASAGSDAIGFLGGVAKAIAKHDLTAIEAAYAAGASFDAASTWHEQAASERDGVRVAHWAPGPAGEATAAAADTATPGVRAHWQAFLATLGTVERAKLKLAAVESLTGAAARVRSFLWIRGHRPEPYEMQAVMRFGLAKTAAGWRITSQEMVRGTTVTGPGHGLADEARARGLDFVAVTNPAFSTPEWFPHRFGIIRFGPGGVSTGDYDGDGWYDVLFPNGDRPRLFRNRGDGSFEDTTERAGLPADVGVAAVGLFADFDNDGDQDLFLGVFTGRNRLLRNEGDGTFTDVTASAGVGGELVTVASATDYDGDGLLDLYVGRYLDPRTELPDTLFYTRNGGGNSLLRNRGDLRFEDVTAAAGVREGGLTLGVSWADYDHDGDEDLHVANDFGRDALFRNRGDGTFEDVAAEAGTLDFGYTMSSAWGDVDNDGDWDIYTGDVHSGQRWYGQAVTMKHYLLNSLRQGTLLADWPLYREIYGFAGDRWQGFGDLVTKGNALYLNDGSGRFHDVSETANANPYGWYWGSGMFDVDNDGRLDIYAANGWITAKQTDDL